jgi:cytochrome c556
MTRKIALPLAAALAIATFAGAASGDGHVDKEIEASIKARKSLMQLRSYNLGILGSMAKGEIEYDAAQAASVAKNLASVSSADWSVLWVEGSAQGVVPDTRAKAEIWSDPAGFEQAVLTEESAANAMAAAAGTDLDALRAAMGPVGKACGTCHDNYRGPRN